MCYERGAELLRKDLFTLAGDKWCNREKQFRGRVAKQKHHQKMKAEKKTLGTKSSGVEGVSWIARDQAWRAQYCGPQKIKSKAKTFPVRKHGEKKSLALAKAHRRLLEREVADLKQ